MGLGRSVGSGQEDTDSQMPWAWNGTRRIVWPVPADFLPPPALPALADFPHALRGALAEPVDSSPLRVLARAARRVAVVVPDGSRKVPAHLILPTLSAELASAGVPTDGIQVIIGCGLHRTTTAQERREMLGADVVDRLPVSDAHAQESPHVEMGTTSLGCPVVLTRSVVDADLVVSVGVVEPHLYAGFSGGVKGVAIGCAGQPTIAWTHAPAFISRPDVRLARLSDNPFQSTIREIAQRTSLRFAVNTTTAAEGVAAVAAGDPVAVQATLVARHLPSWHHEVQACYDLVVAGVPAPKHKTLYQASRAATYIGLAAHPAVRDGGLILLCADLPLGAGDGPGETNFADLLGRAAAPAVKRTPGGRSAERSSRRHHSALPSPGLDDLLERGLRAPLGPGGQRAFVVARVLRRHRIGVLGDVDPELVTALGMEYFGSVQEAVAAARPRPGQEPRTLVIADAFTSVVTAARGKPPA